MRVEQCWVARAARRRGLSGARLWAELGSAQREPTAGQGSEDPGQGVEPRPPRSERGVLPVRRSRSVAKRMPGLSPSVHLHRGDPRSGEGRFNRRLHGRLAPNDVFQATRSTLRPWIGRTGHAYSGDARPTWRGFGAWASALRVVIAHAKASATMHPQFRATREEPFSLERGLNTVYVFFKLSIILCSSP